MTKKYFYLICMILVALNCTVKSEKNTSSASAIAVNEDIKEVIGDLYSSVNYEGDQPPDWELMRSLFLESFWFPI